MSKKLLLNLQRFAEGAAAADGDSGVESDAADQNTEELFENETGEVEKSNTQEEEIGEETFEDLIKGKYKKDFNSKMSGIVQDRVKNMQDNLEKLDPVMSLLSKKYGVDVKEVDKLAEAIMNDDSYYEEEANERGIDVATLKHIKELERQNEQFADEVRQRNEDNRNQEAWAEVLRQGEELKTIYPDFDLEDEMQNEQFGRLIGANIDVKTAFEVVHQDEIQPQVMRYVADKTARKVANAVKSNKNRPQEGTGSSPVKVKKDVSKLTDAERDEINSRILAGEDIYL